MTTIFKHKATKSISLLLTLIFTQLTPVLLLVLYVPLSVSLPLSWLLNRSENQLPEYRRA